MPRRPCKILIAEDNKVNQVLIEGMLRVCGHKADFASHGAEAVEKYNKSTYDLILMDCNMPIMDGYEAAITIRAIEYKNHSEAKIPIIALCADASQDNRKKCLDAGMNFFLAKPVNLAEFQELLKGLLPADCG